MVTLQSDATFADADDRAGFMAAYDQHLAEVRDDVASDRLVEWQPGDGWKPLCSVLGTPVPEESFPQVNTTAQFTAHFAFT